MRADMCKLDEIEGLYKEVVDHWGTVDVLVRIFRYPKSVKFPYPKSYAEVVWGFATGV